VGKAGGGGVVVLCSGGRCAPAMCGAACTTFIREQAARTTGRVVLATPQPANRRLHDTKAMPTSLNACHDQQSLSAAMSMAEEILREYKLLWRESERRESEQRRRPSSSQKTTGGARELQR